MYYLIFVLSVFSHSWTAAWNGFMLQYIITHNTSLYLSAMHYDYGIPGVGSGSHVTGINDISTFVSWTGLFCEVPL